MTMPQFTRLSGPHHPGEQDPQRRANLLALAEYLDTGVTEYGFDMLCYQAESDDHPCGTVACAIGHAPFVLGSEAPSDEDWIGYTNKHLSPDFRSWFFCFCENWEHIDNTPRGAAARIFYMLQHGVPEDHPWTPVAPHPLPVITPAKRAAMKETTS